MHYPIISPQFCLLEYICFCIYQACYYESSMWWGFSYMVVLVSVFFPSKSQRVLIFFILQYWKLCSEVVPLFTSCHHMMLIIILKPPGKSITIFHLRWNMISIFYFILSCTREPIIDIFFILWQLLFCNTLAYVFNPFLPILC